MESLEKLPNIVRLSERVLRVLGLNPGKFTLQGTNTYLIGKGPRKILLDAGEGIPEYIPLLQTALDKDLQGATISKVICSHWHHDHVGGVSDVMQFLAARNIHLDGPSTPATANAGSASPSVHKYPSPEHDDPELQFQGIEDQQEIKVDDHTTLVTWHTPGHTSDHCSFYLKEENTLFTADCVLGHGTAVFEDLSAYIKSLERQLTILAPGGGPASYKIYPGHGPVIEDGPSKVREYIKHRLDREKQIMAVLGNSTESNSDSSPTEQQNPLAGAAGKTARQIVEVIYEAYPVSLHPAAEHQVLLHLKKLEQDGKVKRSSAEEISDALWVPIQPTQASL
ncbi:hypothetical protein KVV02_004260 [Mortierella alpina]|uniref:Metallo-beta-lactamase domain-containing protein n=1 Tax=Mortierella alpina TaxID=64518 RepID=A0A9P8A3G2_MORAP|nr:hypothetical protein KVV02_004260 [Mortierella alpina]